MQRVHGSGLMLSAATHARRPGLRRRSCGAHGLCSRTPGAALWLACAGPGPSCQCGCTWQLVTSWQEPPRPGSVRRETGLPLGRRSLGCWAQTQRAWEPEILCLLASPNLSDPRALMGPGLP